MDLAGEPTKHGAALDIVRVVVERAVQCRAVRLAGLMLLPPWLEDPEDVRPYFRSLRELRDRLVASGVPVDMLRELSMGMSHDFERGDRGRLHDGPCRHGDLRHAPALSRPNSSAP